MFLKVIKVVSNFNQQNTVFVLGHLLIALLTDEVINLYQMAKKLLRGNVDTSGRVKNGGWESRDCSLTSEMSIVSTELSLNMPTD